MAFLFLYVFPFSPVVSFHQRSTLIFIYMLLLPQGQSGEACKPSKKQRSFGNRGQLDEKSVYFSSEDANLQRRRNLNPIRPK
jgi:hypothetical protein